MENFDFDAPVNFVRLERPATGSWITFHCHQPIPIEELVEYVSQVMPGWEWNGAAMEHDPSNDNDDIVEAWRDEAWDCRTWHSPITWG